MIDFKSHVLLMNIHDCFNSGASEEFIDLPSLGSWNQNQTEAEGLNHVLDFDGVEDAILIPVEKFRPDLGSRFTVLTWMKHSENSASGYDKEQILCHSDAEGGGCLWSECLTCDAERVGV